MQSHHIVYHDQQGVSDTTLFFSHLISWLTASEQCCPLFSASQSHHILPHGQACKQHCPCLLWPVTITHLIPLDQQLVSVDLSNISSHARPIQEVGDTIFLYKTHLMPCPIACEWHCPCFQPCNLITFHPMSNSLWVTLSLPLPYSISSQLIPWMTGSGWYFFCQAVSWYLIPWLTGSEWYSFILVVSSPLIPWLTASEWLPFFPARLHQISSHATGSEWGAPFLARGLILPCPMTNRKCVTLPFSLSHTLITFHPINSKSVTPLFFWNAILSPFIPFPIACEWYCLVYCR